MRKDEILDEIFQLLKNEILKNENTNRKVVEYKSPEELKHIFKNNFDFGSSDEELIDLINNYIKFSVKTSSKQFHNQLFAGTSLPSLLGELTSVVMNASNYTYEVSPIGTIMERDLIQKNDE